MLTLVNVLGSFDMALRYSLIKSGDGQCQGKNLLFLSLVVHHRNYMAFFWLSIEYILL